MHRLFVEGGFKVKKIVLIADHLKESRMLVKCISILFPECEIEVVPRNKEIEGMPILTGQRTK